MSDSQETLSPTISSLSFPTYVSTKLTLERVIERHQPNHDTSELLTTFFTYIPLDGKINLVEDMDRCANVEELTQLADSLDTGLLRPLLAHGGATPTITPSPRLGVEDSIENLIADNFQSATRGDQHTLRGRCLQRDGHRCVVSKAWDPNYEDRPLRSFELNLETAHIIPFALGSFQENDEDERYRQAAIWVNLNRYFPELRSRLQFSPALINEEYNAMMLTHDLHQEFGRYHVIFEATSTINRYRIKTFPKFVYGLHRDLPADGILTLTCNDGRYNLPHPLLLSFHAAIGNILHLTGRGERIESIKQDLDGMGGGLATDGSTAIGSLLSVTRLSIISSAAKDGPDRKQKPRPPQVLFSGSENQRPKSAGV